MIRAGIVGLGRWGRTLVESVAGGSGAIRFVAGHTRTPANAEAFAAAHGIRLHRGYGDLLADDGVDAVVLASPHGAHFAQIVSAAAAGKHVFCEKPFCLSAAEAREALDALASRGLRVAIGHNRRFSPNALALSEMVRGGALGEMIQIEGNFSAPMSGYAGSWRDSRAESPAGGMTSLGIHVVDMFVHLFGRVEAVQAVGARVATPLDLEDAMTVLLRFESGRLGYLGTVAATAQLWQVRAFGTDGWAEILDHDRLAVRRTGGGGEVRTWEGFAYPGLPTVAAALEAFARDCSGGEPFPVTPDEIHHGTAVLEAVVRSADGGGRVRVG